MQKLKKYKYAIQQLFFVVLLLLNTLTGLNKINASPATDGRHLMGDLSFIENKGQWIDEARFKVEMPGGAVFITDNGFVYNFRSSEDMERIQELQCSKGGGQSGKANFSNELIRYHAYSVSFTGAKLPGQYVAQGKRNYHHNYFIGNDQSTWAGLVGLYEKVIREGIYKGIDLAVYSTGTKLKYDFIVAAGADPDQIALSFEGVQPELTENGDLKIKTSVNEVIEQAPYVYQIINGQMVTVQSRYKLSKGQLTFEFPKGYNSNHELVIDPILVFSTYSGNTGGGSLANCTTHDDEGNLFAGAFTVSMGWPTTLGAYKEKHIGLYDVGINKYNSNGTALLYSTYFGGWDDDNVHAMIVNKAGELIIAGNTNSSDLPVISGCYDDTYNGKTGVYNGGDIFVARFNQAGDQLLAATYIGGSNNDADYRLSLETISPLEVALSSNGDIWVVSNTNSADFPVTTNAFQSTNAGGYDGVIFGLNQDCSQLLYSSYIGGSGDDGCYNIVVNSEGDIVLCGNTESNDFPTTIGVIHGTAPGGSRDGFVTIINAENGALLASTYIGTAEADQAYRLQVDAEDNVFVLGSTLGDYPVSPGVYHMPGATTFIDKLSPSLNQSLLSTRIGKRYRPVIPSAFLRDICGNIYFTGFNADANLPVTDDAHEKAPRSFWFCVLKPGFSELKYASYFGSTKGDHAEYGIHRFDPQGIVYQAICTQSDQFPTTPNAVFPKKMGTGVDNLSFKFDFQIPIVNSRFELLPELSDSGCAPYSVQFVNTSRFGNRFIWDFGDGSPLSYDSNTNHTFKDPGIYTVTLYVENDTTCNKYDTSYRIITVLSPPELEIAVKDTSICNFDQEIVISVNVHSSGINQRIQWSPTDGIIGHSNTASIKVNPFINNIYHVAVTVEDSLGICNVSVRDTLRISKGLVDMLLSGALNIQAACKGDINGMAWLDIDPVDTNSYSFLWKKALDTAVLSHTDTLKNVPPGKYTLQIATPKCDTILEVIIPEEDFKVSFRVDSIVCVDEFFNFENTSDPHFSSFNWNFDDGRTANFPFPGHSYNNSGVYNVQLIGEGKICKDTAFRTITVDPVIKTHFSTDKDSICEGESITFTHEMDIATITDLNWQTGDGQDFSYFDPKIRHAYDRSGIMPVILTARFRACPESYYADTVYVFDLPKVDLGAESSICLNGAPIYLKNRHPEAEGIFHYLWNTGVAMETLKVTHAGTYSLTVSSMPMGCSNTESIEITKDCYIDIPNAFTPDGDGVNDYFFPRQLLSKNVIAFKMQVFNRWGQAVFETSNLNGRGWDGRFNGRDQPQGVYLYIIKAEFEGDRSEQYEGNITLLR